MSKKSVSSRQRYSGIVRQTKDFIINRYNEIFQGKTIEEVIDLLSEFKEGLDKKDSNLLKKGQEAFLDFLYQRELISLLPQEQINSKTYGNYRNSVLKLEKYAEELMNNFRGYFDTFNKETSSGDYNANKLIYLIASNTKRNRQISVAFTDFKTLLEQELKNGERLYASSNTLIDQFASDRFSSNKKFKTSNEALTNEIGSSRINNINYFLNQVINGEYTGDRTGITEFGDDSIITQIRRVIKVGDTYKGQDGKTQTVTSARVVDILLGNGRLEKVATGQWYGKDGVLEDLKQYASSFKQPGFTRKEDYLSKMLGENTPGVLEGDATKFMDGKYDVQIKTQLDGNKGLGMIVTNALAANWIMFTNPYLMASIITDNINNDKGGLSKEDEAAMNLWAEDALAIQMESGEYSEENSGNFSIGEIVYDLVTSELGGSEK